MANSLSKKVRLSAPVEMLLPFDIVRGAGGEPDDEKRIIRGRFYKNARVPGDLWNLPLEAVKRAAPKFMESPCIRAMHQPIAAGKALDLWFPDNDGGHVEAYIGDDNEWNKCKTGIYRQLSVRFRPTLARGYDVQEGEIVEISLVDRGKDPDCDFSIARGEVAEGDYEVEILPGDDDDSDGIARGAADYRGDYDADYGHADYRGVSRAQAAETALALLERVALGGESVAETWQRVTGVQRAAQADTTNNISRADTARNDGDISRLEGELESSRATVARLEGQLGTREREIARLRDLPAPPPGAVVFKDAVPQAIERVFAANDFLSGGLNRPAMQAKKSELQEKAKRSDLSGEERQSIATELCRLDIVLSQS